MVRVFYKITDMMPLTAWISRLRMENHHASNNSKNANTVRVSDRVYEIQVLAGHTYTAPEKKTPSTWTLRLVLMFNPITGCTGNASIATSVTTLTTL